MILPARTWQRRRQLRIRKRTAKRTETADRPKHQEREAAGQASHLESKAGENPRANHVRDHETGRGQERDRAR